MNVAVKLSHSTHNCLDLYCISLSSPFLPNLANDATEVLKYERKDH